MEANEILDDSITASTTERSIIKEMAEIKSIRVNLEKLDGGYISDAKGTRKIYAKKSEILEDIGMPSILDGILHDEYKLHIDLIPKEKFDDYVDAMNFGIQAKEQEKSNKELVDELVEKNTYNPFKSGSTEEFSKEIKIDGKNCYSTARLKSIDWQQFNEKLPMTIVEMSEVSGVPKTALYSIMASIKKGTYTFTSKNARIGLTILAKFYEANLGIRTTIKENNDLMKQTLLNNIREIELMNTKSGFIKYTEIAKKLGEMKKILLT